MRFAAASCLALATLLVAACGGTDEDGGAEPSPSPPTTQTRPADGGLRPLAVYFVREGRLGAAKRFVASTPAVGRAALEQLLAGPTDEERDGGLASDVPPGTEIDRLVISESGVADVVLSNSLDDLATAQIVHTLAQFATVERVLLEGEQHVPDDFEHVLPAILVESPVPGETVSSPLRIRGTANTFEATFQVELRVEGSKPLVKDFVTATSGSGTRGTFDESFDFEVDGEQAGTLVVYELSAEDGSVINEVEIPLTLVP